MQSATLISPMALLPVVLNCLVRTQVLFCPLCVLRALCGWPFLLCVKESRCPTAQQDRPGVVGLHDAGPRDPRRRRAADGEGHRCSSRAAGSAWCSTTRWRTSTWPRRWSTSTAWRQSTADNPVGHLRPDRPDRAAAAGGAARQRPGPRRSQHAHFWGMDEWVVDGREVPPTHPLSLRQGRHGAVLQPHPPGAAHAARRNLHFPPATCRRTRRATTGVRCVVMQGGQGEVKHWAFNDPPRAQGQLQGRTRRRPQEYRKLGTRVVDLHPMTIIQNARTSRRRATSTCVPTQAAHRRAGRDLEGREGLHLAGRHARQPLRHAADHADDRQEAPRLRRARCRCWPTIPTCSSTSTARRIGTVPGGDALKRQVIGNW